MDFDSGSDIAVYFKHIIDGTASTFDYIITGVAALIAVVAIISLCVSVVLAISYISYNRKKNSADMTGREIAERTLKDNNITNIKVKCTGSLIFGNSYGHYFKKIRLRRFTWKKKTITSLAMGAQKAQLAVLDKEGDPDMKARIRLVPFTMFGPFMLIPLILVGVILDLLILKTDGFITLVFSALGIVFYILSLSLSVKTLKTEKKAQQRAYEYLKKNNLATADELEDMQHLFKLYNIEYINDTIIAMLQLLYYVLQIIGAFTNNNGVSAGSSSSD